MKETDVSRSRSRWNLVDSAALQERTGLEIRVSGPECRKMEHKETLWCGCCCKKRENRYMSKMWHSSFKEGFWVSQAWIDTWLGMLAVASTFCPYPVPVLQRMVSVRWPPRPILQGSGRGGRESTADLTSYCAVNISSFIYAVDGTGRRSMLIRNKYHVIHNYHLFSYKTKKIYITSKKYVASDMHFHLNRQRT